MFLEKIWNLRGGYFAPLIGLQKSGRACVYTRICFVEKKESKKKKWKRKSESVRVCVRVFMCTCVLLRGKWKGKWHYLCRDHLRLYTRMHIPILNQQSSHRFWPFGRDTNVSNVDGRRSLRHCFASHRPHPLLRFSSKNLLKNFVFHFWVDILSQLDSSTRAEGEVHICAVCIERPL